MNGDGKVVGTENQVKCDGIFSDNKISQFKDEGYSEDNIIKIKEMTCYTVKDFKELLECDLMGESLDKLKKGGYVSPLIGGEGQVISTISISREFPQNVNIKNWVLDDIRLDLRDSIFKGRSEIQLQFIFSKLSEQNHIFAALDLRGAEINGDFSLGVAGNLKSHKISLAHSLIKREFLLSTKTGLTDCLEDFSIDARQIRVNGDLRIGQVWGDGFKIKKTKAENENLKNQIDFSDAFVGGHLHCNITRADESNDYPLELLDFSNVEVTGAAYLAEKTSEDMYGKVEGVKQIWFRYSKIKGECLQFARISAETIDCFGLEASSLFFASREDYPTHIVDFVGASSFIKSEVVVGKRLVGKQGKPLNCRLEKMSFYSSTIGGDVEISSDAIVNSVDFSDATVKGIVYVDFEAFPDDQSRAVSLRPTVSKENRTIGLYVYASICIAAAVLGFTIIFTTTYTYGMPLLGYILFLGVFFLVIWPAFRAASSFKAKGPIPKYSFESSSSETDSETSAEPDEIEANIKCVWNRLWREAAGADLLSVFLFYLRKPTNELKNLLNKKRGPVMRRDMIFAVTDNKNVTTTLNFARAQINEVKFEGGIPGGLDLEHNAIRQWAINNAPPAFPEAILENAKEYRSGNYVSTEQLLRSRGDLAAAERVFRTHKAYERMLEPRPLRVLLTLAHGVIGYGTRRLRLLGFLVAWMLLTTLWFGWDYDKLFGIGTGEWANIAQVVSVETGASPYPWKRAETDLDGRIKALRIDHVTDSWSKRWGNAFHLAFRYHIPITGVDLVPHLQPKKTVVSGYVKFVTVINLILWPLFIASALPSILPRAEKN